MMSEIGNNSAEDALDGTKNLAIWTVWEQIEAAKILGKSRCRIDITDWCPSTVDYCRQELEQLGYIVQMQRSLPPYIDDVNADREFKHTGYCTWIDKKDETTPPLLLIYWGSKEVVSNQWEGKDFWGLY